METCDGCCSLANVCLTNIAAQMIRPASDKLQDSAIDFLEIRYVWFFFFLKNVWIKVQNFHCQSQMSSKQKIKRNSAIKLEVNSIRVIRKWKPPKNMKLCAVSESPATTYTRSRSVVCNQVPIHKHAPSSHCPVYRSLHWTTGASQ